MSVKKWLPLQRFLSVIKTLQTQTFRTISKGANHKDLGDMSTNFYTRHGLSDEKFDSLYQSDNLTHNTVQALLAMRKYVILYVILNKSFDNFSFASENPAVK